MLTLIAGITGSLGRRLVVEATKRGHSVRGLGRSPSKFPESIRSSLESFVEIDSYFDVPTLDKACRGCDAVVCAYAPVPELQLEAQLLLLRAAERAGIKKFVADSWNSDYRLLGLNDHESYAPYISFRNQVELSSMVKPIFVMTGAFAETWLASPEQGYNSDNIPGLPWNPSKKQVNTYGTGDEPITCCTMRDAAEYTIRILESPNAEKGGDYFVSSFTHTTKEMIEIYQRATGIKLDLRIHGSLDKLRELGLEKRKQGSKLEYWKYIGWIYLIYTLDGTFESGHNTASRNREFPDGMRTDLETFFKSIPY